MQSLAIANQAIRQINGLFSLNDLHSAAGGAAKHQPALFARRAATRALLVELGASTESQTPLQVINDGANNGTYACRELVIAYAAWISAAFHLKVIRVFLAASDAAPNGLQLSPAQKQHLSELVDIVAASGLQSHAETWARLHRKFKVNTYHALPAVQFDAACAYLKGKMQGHNLAALIAKHFPQALPVQRPAQLPAPSQRPRITVDAQHLADIWQDLGKLRSRIDGLGVMASDLPPSWWQQQRLG